MYKLLLAKKLRDLYIYKELLLQDIKEFGLCELSQIEKRIVEKKIINVKKEIILSKKKKEIKHSFICDLGMKEGYGKLVIVGGE